MAYDTYESTWRLIGLFFLTVIWIRAPKWTDLSIFCVLQKVCFLDVSVKIYLNCYSTHNHKIGIKVEKGHPHTKKKYENMHKFKFCKKEKGE